MAQHLLDVRDLCISFVGRDGNALEAVNKLNLHIDAGEIVGVVGESGCGKSVFAQSVMRLLEHEQKMAYTGQILFDGEDLLARPLKRMREVRGCDIAMIFQDPLSSLNPVMTVGAQVVEAVRAHRKVSRREARSEALSLLERVGIRDAAARFDMYPGDFSGGMRQRVMIAMALACEPDILIADEPTTALDVTIQAQILELMKDLQKKLGMAIIMITHDLGVIADMCDEIIVMYAGRICERGTVDEIFYNPRHEYTKGLLRSIPKLDARNQRLIPIAGSPVDLTSMPAGCAFASRCDCAMKICLTDLPEELPINENHRAACWMNVKHVYDEAKKEGAAQ